MNNSLVPYSSVIDKLISMYT